MEKMKIKKGYARSGDGITHLISAINGEYTLCGDAFDGGIGVEEPDQTPWDKCECDSVTCEKCIREIDNCRGVRVKRQTSIHY